MTACTWAGVEITPTHGRNLYRLAVAELDGHPAAKEIIGSTYDNRVCAFADNGAHRWDAAIGGFVFDLAVGDLDGDGREEIIAASADGSVNVFSPDGNLRWKQDLGAPVYQVAVAKLDGTTPVVLAGGISRQIVVFSADGTKRHHLPVNGAVRILRAGDFDGDGADEVAALLVGGFARQDMLFFKGPTLTQLKETIARKSPSGDPLLSLKNANGTVADLDGDGAAELVWKRGAYTLKGGLHPVFDLPSKIKERSYDYHYTMRLVASGDLTDRPGAETVVVEGPQVRLYDAKGRELGQAIAPFGFTDVIYVPGSPHGSVLLGSSPNGDDNLYRLTFSPGWEKSLERLARRGVMAAIGTSLKQLGDTAAAWRGDAMPGADGPFDVIVASYWWNGGDPRKLGPWIAEVRDYEKRFPYPRLRFAVDFWPSEKSALLRPDGKPWGRERRLAYDQTRAQIVAAAKYFEAERCPFWINIGHSTTPYVEVATVAAMLKAAPTTLQGFVSTEAEQSDTLPYYFEHFLKPVLELCVQHKKRLIITSKNVAWAHTPADPKLRASILDPRYRSALLPSVEDSNSRSPDVNLAARVGLWLDRQVDDWAVRSAADWFSFNRDWEWEYPMTGHPHLRYYVSQALLGARVFMALNGEREPRTGHWTRVGSEGTATFLHLLGRGVITPPRREQLRSISPVALVMKNPSERFAQHGANGHQEANWNLDGTDTQRWAFERLDCYWGMAPLPPTDVATYLWGRTRRDPSQLATTTPHGFVALVPGATPHAAGPWKTIWTTDGDNLSRDGETFTLAEARTALTADLAEGAKQFPFAVTGRVFHQVIEVSPRRYVIALVDSGWLDPADCEVRIAAQIPGRWQLSDRVTGATLGILPLDLAITVPAGTFRLLEVRDDTAPAPR
ncbi:MAG: hypothetical protein JNK23_20820 [Opitutaceae bacterium]|nr:hypothetical protein [Opitutaceae bacterium]